MLTAYYGNVGALRALLSHGEEVGLSLACRVTRRTALHWACVRGHAECVAALVAAGADKHALDSEGKTAWDLAGEAVRAVLRPAGV